MILPFACGRASRAGRRTFRALVLLFVCTFVPSASSAQQSGDAGEARDWDRFRSLFAPGATLSPVGRPPDDSTYGRRVMTPAQYVEGAGTSLEANGFHEVEIHRVTEQYGIIAHTFSTYESRRRAADAEPFARGINSFQLLYDGNRWWVVSIYWLQEGPDHPIPEKYLPGGDGEHR